LEKNYDFRISVERDKDAKGQDNRRPRNQSKYVFSPDAVSDVVLRELGLIKKTDGKVELGFTHLFTDSTKSPQVDRSQESEIEENPSGLIIVAGGTGTGKSTYARGIILRYLLRLAIKRLETTKKELQKFDPPHLVTYEDPIETWSVDYHGAKVKKNSLNLLEESESDLEAGIRITCRAKKYDVEALSSACIHALRQKPKIVYIGECRESKDWNLALELGGTGHLVVTTCHSASLVDTFVKVAGSESRDAQSRQKLASSLLGVLHLKTGKFKQSQAEPGVKEPCIPESFKQNQTYFSLWKNKPESVSNFVVDGLASLIIDDDNILSRRRMAELTLAIQAKDEGEILTDDLNQPKEKEEFFKMLSEVAKEMAFKIDLERN
jgi:type II secretory ATPase GspE/PulE/Tfp pilus assembly ATPase PilB-like protein